MYCVVFIYFLQFFSPMIRFFFFNWVRDDLD